jgi:lambda family phage portal protein
LISRLFTAPAKARQEAAITPEASVGGYPASNRGGWGGWTTGEKSPGGLSASGTIRTFDQQTIRLNSRDALYDSPHARGIVQRFADTVADVGLSVKPEPVASVLGIDPSAAEAWSDNVKERFHLWAKSKDSAIDGVNNFYQNQWLYSFSQQRDNDQFVRLMYSKDKELISPLQVGMLDPDQIVGNGYTTTLGPQYNNDGIERDGRGKETGYRIVIWNGEQYTVRRIKAKGANGRIHMLHGFHPEYAGQGRGYSRLAHALQEFEQMTDFSQAQIEKAINQSQISMYVKPSKDNPASNPMEDILNSYSGPAPSAVIGATPTDAPLGADVVNFTSLYEATFRQPGATMVANLMDGEDLSAFQNTAPSESFDKFVNAFISHLSASVSMPVEVLLMSFKNNYSASRATLVLFWRVVEQWRREMAADFLDPVYYMWLSEEIAAGRIVAPGFSDPRMRAAWCSARWQGVPMPNIDPLKEVNAAKERAILGQETLEDGAQNFNGSSWKANNEKLKREFEGQELPKWHANVNLEGGVDTDMDDDDEKENGGKNE